MPSPSLSRPQSRLLSPCSGLRRWRPWRLWLWLAWPVACSLGACSGMSGRQQDTAVGAGVSAVGGAILTGGSGIGTVGGAAVGAVIGNEVGKDKR